MINAVIVGYGGMGSYHPKLIKSEKNIKIIGIFDIDINRCNKAIEDGYFAYQSYNDVINDKSVDLVIIATPNDSHLDLTIKALKAKKHVVCEKPVVLKSEELLQIISVSKENNVHFFVHQNRRWDEDYLVIKNIIDNNIIGEVFQIESRVHGGNGIPRGWREDINCGGGMVYDWGVHIIDQLLQLNKSKIINIYAETSYVLGFDVDDGFRVIIKFEDGMNALLEVGTTNFIKLPRWYLKGLNGTAVISDWDLSGKIVKLVNTIEDTNPTHIVAGAGLTKTMAPPSDSSVIEEELPKLKTHLISFYQNVYNVIIKNDKQLIDNMEVYKVLEVLEWIFREASKI